VKARRARKSGRSRAGDAGVLKRLRQAERRLQQVQERYEIAMGAINESVYDWNIPQDRVYFSGGMERLLALPPGMLKTSFKEWHERIHPEDFARYREATIAHLKGTTDRFECDYRYRVVDGTWRWARTHGLAQRDARGRAVRMVGSTGDITELKRAEDALRKSEERYALATSAAVEGIYEWDVETGTLFLTERAKTFFSFPAEALTPAAWNARVHGEDYPGYRAAILDHFKGRTPYMEHEYRIAGGRGGYRWLLDRGIGVRNADGRVTKMIGALSDITQRKLAEIELRRARDRAEEALEQQTATAEILKVTSRSPSTVQPVFDAILASASRLCEASFAAVFLHDGELLRNVAHRNASPEFARVLQRMRARPSRETTTRRCALEQRTIHTADLLNDPEFCPPEPQRRENVRTALSVPMMREGVLVGVITLWRAEVRPFTEKQIALVETFADQAVIAIENVRLFNQTRDALEQQTAIAEVQRVISKLQTNVQPVFDSIAANALKLCDAKFSVIFRFDGELIHLAALHNVSSTGADAIRQAFPVPPGRGGATQRAILTQGIVHIPDIREDPEYVLRGLAEKADYRSILSVPMLRDETVVGAITVVRAEPTAFPDKQIALLKTFADQAVIAIENVRLFNEIQEKSRQLEVASRHKSEFLANMSHELRTPLNAIIGFTRIVMRRSQEKLEPKQYENLEKILSSGEHLLALINSILDLSKVEAGRIEVNPGEVRLASVLESCVRTVEPLVKADAVTLLKEFDGGLPALYVDEEKLRQIIINLLSNAAKFTSRGSIRVRAQAANGAVSIAVADTGIGIPADKLGLIFEEFQQADASSTRVHGGTGLGLTIARRLARLMGGDIAVESTLGSGSTFTLTLPVRYGAQS
jgi:PAS domain S-box-containing protein